MSLSFLVTYCRDIDYYLFFYMNDRSKFQSPACTNLFKSFLCDVTNLPFLTFKTYFPKCLPNNNYEIACPDSCPSPTYSPCSQKCSPNIRCNSFNDKNAFPLNATCANYAITTGMQMLVTTGNTQVLFTTGPAGEQILSETTSKGLTQR